MARSAQIPLVGPGHELQLTLDGRAVPHAEVVAANAAAPPAPTVPAVLEVVPSAAQTTLADA